MDILSYLLGKKAGGGVTPSGSISINENGIYDVTNYASASVSVPDLRRNWTLVGYTGEPSFIEAGYEYAKTIYDNNDPSVTDWEGHLRDNLNLIFMPLIDTSNVTTMRSLFNGDVNLLYVPALNTSNVTSMYYMFSNCASLHYIDFTNFDTSNVTTMEDMFMRCFSLTNLTLPFNTSRVTTMGSMFNEDFNLRELDISSFTSEALTTTSTMFYNCRLLTKIDMRKLTFSGVTHYNNMFGAAASSGPPNDCLIIVKDNTEKTWITSKFSRLTNVQTVAEYEAS